MRYVITVTDEQLSVLSEACEFFARVNSGQIAEVKQALSSKAPADAVEAANNIPLVMSGTGYGTNDIFGLHAWDLYQVFRHRLAWDRKGNPSIRNWGTMWAVQYDEPFQVGPGPLAIVEARRDEDP